MTRFYKNSWFVFLAIFALACSDDDSLPLPTADFSIDGAPVEVGIPVMFDNRSLNAARYEWNFGDGADPITDISPSVTFSTPGNVTVTLTAFTEDDQFVESTQEFTVLERVFTGISINIYPESNAGTPWDPDETGVDTLADVVVILSPSDSPEPEEVIVTPLLENVLAPFGFSINDGGPRIVLTDEDWVILMDDFDGEDINSATQDDFERITGVQFNPVQGLTFKSQDGLSGFISILGVDNAAQGQIDIDLSFELQ